MLPPEKLPPERLPPEADASPPDAGVSAPWSVTLAAELDAAMRPLLAALPPAQAMTRLVVVAPPAASRITLVEQTLAHPALQHHPRRELLAAGLWLYVDDLDRSHRLCQARESEASFNYWHAIMHRREADFCNSKYWLRRVGRHPAQALVAPGFDPVKFVDAVAQAYRQGGSPSELVALQQREWWTLWSWAAGRT